MTPIVQGLLFLAIGVILLWIAFADPDSVIGIIERFTGR